MSPHTTTSVPHNDGAVRALGAVGLCGVALIHLLDLPGKLSETPYMFFMYLGLIVSSVALAGALLWSGDARIWKASAGLTTAVIVGYVLSRTTGLPSATDDIGNWGEPLGIASLFVEGCLLALSSGALVSHRVGQKALSRRREKALSAVLG